MDLVSPFQAGLLCRCPRCGQGALCSGILTVRERFSPLQFRHRRDSFDDS